MVPRALKSLTNSAIEKFPVVAIIGPRQVGKSTLAKQLLCEIDSSVYMDLEKPEDLHLLRSAPRYLRSQAESLVCLDEIQREPEIFPLLRSVIDEFDRKPRYLILGSASPDLLRQSSESLAGRIRYLELTPFRVDELPKESISTHWLRGGYPLSFLANSDSDSYEWRESFISTYIERDLPSLGFRRSSSLVRRVWSMLAHYNSQVLNKAKLSQALDLSSKAIGGYIEMLEDTFMLRVLPPYIANTKKRLIKSPKIFIRDTGLLHYLLGLRTVEDLYRHPSYGCSWESFVVENILSGISRDWQASFYRNRRGDELDLILERSGEVYAIECKSGTTPTLSKSNFSAIEDVKPRQTLVVAPVERSFEIDDKIEITSLMGAIDRIRTV